MLNGKKTYIGIGLLVVGLLVSQWGGEELAEAAKTLIALGIGLTGVGARHAIKKAAPAAVALILLAGCNTLPATQTAKDEAGRSEVTQKAESTQNDLRHLLPRNMKIESPGEVRFTFNFYGNERSSDISQSNQGSTTTETAKDQGSTQTPTVTPTVDTNVSGLPGQ